MNTEKVSVKSQAKVNLPGLLVWSKLIAFGGTEKFVPNLIERVVVAGTGVGAVRTVYLKGGGEIIEELKEINDEMTRMKFIILSTPMPLSDYEGIMTVHTTTENTCEVTFESVFKVASKLKDEMNGIIKDFQTTFLSNLDK